MSKRTKTIISLVLNAIVATVTAGIAVSYFFNHTDVIPNGWVSFRFFTTDANLLAAIGSLLVMICDIQILRGKRQNVARAFTLVKYAGVVGLLLTFCVVMVLLVPIYGAARQLGGTSFHMHVTAPLLTFVSFVFFDAHTTLRFRDTFIGLLPEVLYGLFYFLQVVVLENWWDFYAFNQGGRWYLTMPMLFTFSYLLCLLTRLLRNRMTEKTEKQDSKDRR